ncbi:MAG: hypothetical protein CMD58_04940 [Gammaproteobacteria bacterium]|nr:hypothetical protein [Gammaproteobacteria bacterium]|tara:strand:- start:574 stop:2520 length:1947 start_codon:yes stop_codon:yes gene_type:complete
MSKLLSKLSFFHDVAQGREAGNSAIRQFESDKNLLSISFIRELIQNAIDAWNKNSDQPVKLIFRLVDVESKHQKTLKDLFKPIMPFIKMGIGNNKLEFAYQDKNLYKKALIVEEYNTIGLTGEYNRKKNNEESWHYSNYLFGVNRATKNEGGGSAGVGKITSNMVSDLKAVLFVTSRSDDNKVWAGGRVEFVASHTLGDQSFDNCAFLSNNDIQKKINDLTEDDRDSICAPISNKSDIDLIKEIFKLERPDSEFGTSWIMPAPVHQVDQKAKKELTSVDSYKKIILDEYSWAIVNGLIEIELDGELINKESVMGILNEVYPEKNELSNFMLDVSTFSDTNYIRLKPNWFSYEDLSDAFITENDKNKAFEIFDSENRQTLGLKLPLKLSKQLNDDTYFLMYIQRGEDVSGKSNELVIRDYLPISGVAKSLLSISGDAVNSMLLITEEKLVKFCRSAEQADHTDFVISRAVARGYKHAFARDNINAIKGATKKIYQFFNDIDIHDEDILADIFSVLTIKDIEKGPKNKKNKRKKRKTKNTKKSTIRIKKMDMKEITKSHIKFYPGSNPIGVNEIPLTVKISIEEPALLGSKSNILNYGCDGFKNSNITSSNINIINKSRDHIEFEITDPDFELNISNLDVSRGVNFPVEY